MMAPLVSAEVDLRDFQFMPLDVVRLRDSDLASRVSGEEFRAAVLLSCAAWHQKPAASLPDDDVVLSSLAGFGRVVREWQAVREGALRGRVKCSDGRLYHPVVAEKANEAWAKRKTFLARLIRRIETTSEHWKELRTVVFKRDNFKCRYCGAADRPLECDHVVPVARGGPTVLENLVAACQPCNRSKGAKTLQEWRGHV